MRTVYVWHHPEGDAIEVFGSAERAFLRAVELAGSLSTDLEGTAADLRKGVGVTVGEECAIAMIHPRTVM